MDAQNVRVCTVFSNGFLRNNSLFPYTNGGVSKKTSIDVVKTGLKIFSLCFKRRSPSLTPRDGFSFLLLCPCSCGRNAGHETTSSAEVRAIYKKVVWVALAVHRNRSAWRDGL